MISNPEKVLHQQYTNALQEIIGKDPSYSFAWEREWQNTAGTVTRMRLSSAVIAGPVIVHAVISQEREGIDCLHLAVVHTLHLKNVWKK